MRLGPPRAVIDEPALNAINVWTAHVLSQILKDGGVAIDVGAWEQLPDDKGTAKWHMQLAAKENSTLFMFDVVPSN